MPTLIVGTLDRKLTSMLIAAARRRWPLLRLLPTRWLHPLLRPTARRLRRSLARAAMFTSLAAMTGAVALLLASSLRI